MAFECPLFLDDPTSAFYPAPSQDVRATLPLDPTDAHERLEVTAVRATGTNTLPDPSRRCLVRMALEANGTRMGNCGSCVPPRRVMAKRESQTI